MKESLINKMPDEPKNGINDIVLSHTILDNVHGLIYYSDKEKKIIDYVLFQRLQNIKQLSVVDWIFPGSEHTRFSHSLGVMQIADRMLLQLNQELEIGGLSTFGLKERKLIRFAGLLHDIGHYPLSHVGESVYKKDDNTSFDTIDNLIKKNNEDIIKQINEFNINIDIFPMKGHTSVPYGFHHEEVGAEIIKHDPIIVGILKEECGEDAPDIIADIIRGNVGRCGINPLLVQIIHSELDADRIDYLMRDAKFSGTSFGSFEIEFLISNFTVGKYHEDNILCIKPDAIAAADQYILNRFWAHSQVVNHRDVDIIEWVAIQLIKWMKVNGVFPSGDVLRKEIDAIAEANNKDKYLLFTDYLFWNKVQKIIDSVSAGKWGIFWNKVQKNIDREDDKHISCNEDIKPLAKYLFEHTKPTFKEEKIRIISKDPEEIKGILQRKIDDIDKHTRILYRLLQKKIYDQVPIEVFLKELGKKKNDSGKPELYDIDEDEAKKKRLMEGICICDNGDLHLLCDDKRSLMSIMYNSTLVILRAYDLNV